MLARLVALLAALAVAVATTTVIAHAARVGEVPGHAMHAARVGAVPGHAMHAARVGEVPGHAMHAARVGAVPGHAMHAGGMSAAPEARAASCGEQNCRTLDDGACAFVCAGLTVVLPAPVLAAGPSLLPDSHALRSGTLPAGLAPGLSERPPRLRLL